MNDELYIDDDGRFQLPSEELAGFSLRTCGRMRCLATWTRRGRSWQKDGPTV
jgi:hypothetical protein